MTMIICSSIVLWFTVCVMIYVIREHDRLITRYNQRITDNFAQSYDNKLKIDSINKYIDNKAESVIDNKDFKETFKYYSREQIDTSLKALNDRIKALEENVEDYVVDNLTYGSKEELDRRLTKLEDRIGMK